MFVSGYDSEGNEIDLDNHESVEEYQGDMQDGFDIDLTKLPKNVIKIRVYNDW